MDLRKASLPHRRPTDRHDNTEVVASWTPPAHGTIAMTTEELLAATPRFSRLPLHLALQARAFDPSIARPQHPWREAMVWSRRLLFALFASLICRQAVAETVLLEFTSPTCGPCRGMRPVMEQLKKARYDVREVDTSQEPGLGLAKQYRVENLPTFVVVVDGKERARLVGGNAPLATLVEMIHKGTAIAQQKAATAAADIQAIGQLADASSLIPTNSSSNNSVPGRVVPVGSQPAITRPASMPGSAGGNADRLISATVRITIDDADGKSKGTGTIIDSREGKALILTCGHLFRTSQGKGPIEVSLFTPGPGGAELLTTAEGTLVDYDLERDLALVCFAPERPVAVAAVAPAGSQMQVGEPATAVGCAHGANPEAWATQITAIDRYQGHPNIEAAKAPVEGRSGGGLFNAAGQLVGVCNAADPQRDEGLYAAVPSIHAKLDALKLTFVYQTPSLGATASNAASPAADSPFEVRGQNPTPSMPVFPPITTTPAPIAQAATGEASAAQATPPAAASAIASDPVDEALTPQDRAMLEEINRHGADAEVICIIGPREPGGRSQVIKLDRASPAFIRVLGGTPSAAVETASAAAAGQLPLR
jgi:thiol-disulfide isomerase/thioredoxin